MCICVKDSNNIFVCDVLAFRQVQFLEYASPKIDQRDYSHDLQLLP